MIDVKKATTGELTAELEGLKDYKRQPEATWGSSDSRYELSIIKELRARLENELVDRILKE